MFAKNKLAQLKKLGLTAKTLVVSGYSIKMSDPDSIQITAPPAVIVFHTEWVGTSGVEKVYYAEPMGAPAHTIGSLGTSTSPSYVWTLYRFDGTEIRGSGAIFPTASEFYQSDLDLMMDIGGGSIYSFYGTDVKFAIAAKQGIKKVSDVTMLFSDTATGGVHIGHIVCVAGVTYHATTYVSSNGILIFSTGPGYRFAESLLQSRLLSDTGFAMHGSALRVHGVYVFEHAGKARIALGISDSLGTLYTESGSHPEVNVVFYDVLLHREDSTHTAPWTELTYVGKTVIAPYVASGVVPHADSAPYFGGRWREYWSIGYIYGRCSEEVGGSNGKSCIFPDGLGGVNLILHRPNSAGTGELVAGDLLQGAYLFSPGAAPQRVSDLVFPPISSLQDRPMIYKGKDINICVLERISSGDCRISAIYKGLGTSVAPWAVLPMPALPLVAVRPICVSAARTVLLGLVYDSGSVSTGTFYAEFDTMVSSSWKVLGKIDSQRMVRPKIGFFGRHEYAKLASEFYGTFAVNPVVTMDSYTGY